MAYRLTSTGAQQTGPFYLYGYALAIDSTKTVKSVTLPGNRNVVVLAATLSGAAVMPPAGATAVNLTPVANVFGMFNDGSPVTNGGMDLAGNAYSKTLLGTSVVWSGVTFALGGAGVADAASSVSVPLPAGTFSKLLLLGTGVVGFRPNQTFTVTYTDGTTTSLTQSFSDWHTPQGYAGESIASTMAYRLVSTGAVQNGTYYLYGYSFPINGAKTVKSLTLTANRGVVVLAAALLPSGSAPKPVSLSAAANVNGIFNDGTAVTNGGLDAHSNAYSGKLLGTSLNFSGVSYTLLGAGVPDAVRAATVALPAGNFSTLNLLATGVNGNQASQTFTVTYTDGSTTVVSRSLSDWYTPQHYSGESIASTMAYRITATGAAQNLSFYLYAYSLAINNAKTVMSVTLPANRNVAVLAATLTP